MERKRHSNIEAGQDIGVCSEPLAEPLPDYAVSTSRLDSGTAVHDWAEDLDWSRFPSQGPFSVEEAIARIEEAEKDLDNPTKWISSEEFDKELYQEFPWLR